MKTEEKHVQELTNDTFENAVNATNQAPLLVDFWAPWCGPCRMMAPGLETFAAGHVGEVRVAKVNTDEAPELAARFNIQSIPTLVLFDGGREVDRVSGAVPQSTLESRFLRKAAA